MMRKRVEEMKNDNAASAAACLKQGGFSWWCHVAKQSKLKNVSDECEDKPIETPCGTRSNRKALAAKKSSYEFSD
jgi:hypothetical protein